MQPDEQTRTTTPLEGSDIDGRYKLKSKLGEGGMGVVYLAQQISTNREVALKIVKLDLGDSARIERFEQEIDIISQLSHPSIVRVFDTGTLPGHDLLYVVMEYIDGISLGDVLWHKHAEDQYFKCRTRVEFALEVIYQLCAALTEPHRLDIIHRDIKPENIILAPSSDETVQVKVLDFGIARVLNEKSATRKKMTDARVPFVGTPHYMAPEQVARSQYDARTDLYAVGVILFEMLTGQYPFDDDNVLAILLRKTQNSPPLLTDHIPDAFDYPEVVALTESLLSIEIERRPSDAMHVRRIIEDIRDKYRMRRVRVRAESYLGRDGDGAVVPSEDLDEDERLEPLRSLYRKWLLYPSGRPLNPQAEEEDTGSFEGLAQLNDLSGFGAAAKSATAHTSGTFLPEGDEEEGQVPGVHTSEVDPLVEEDLSEVSEVDEQEDIQSHTDILSSPKRQHLKAWSMDAELSNSFDVKKLQEGAEGIQKLESFFEEEDQKKGELDEAVTSIWKPDLDALPDDLRRSFAGEVDWAETFGDLSTGTTRAEKSEPIKDTREDPAVQGVIHDEDRSIEGVIPPSFASPSFHNTPDPDNIFGAEPAGLGAQLSDGFGAEPLPSESAPSFPKLQLEQETTQQSLQIDDHGLPYDTMPEPLGRDSEMIQKLMAEKEARERVVSLEDLTGEAQVPEALRSPPAPLDEDPTIQEDRPEDLRRPERAPAESRRLEEQRADELELADIGTDHKNNALAKREAELVREKLELKEQRERTAFQKNIIIGILFIAFLILAVVAFAATRGS